MRNNAAAWNLISLLVLFTLPVIVAAVVTFVFFRREPRLTVKQKNFITNSFAYTYNAISLIAKPFAYNILMIY